MKYWAEFYHHQTTEDGHGLWQQGCGDRSVVRLDGRLSLFNMIKVARAEAHHRGFDGFQITRGDNLLDTLPLNEMITPVDKG